MRFNNGAIDPQGRYWAGTMNDPTIQAPSPDNPEGVLFRFDSDGSLHRMLEGVTIPNGICWSLDGKVMYFIDSPTKSVSSFDFDGETGAISQRKGFFSFSEEEAGGGVPDGMTIDVEGCLWIAACGGGKVVVVNPVGEKVGEVLLPTRMVSCPGFVGDMLFITSAEEEEPERYPQSVEFGGSLFRVEVGAQGAPVREYIRQW